MWTWLSKLDPNTLVGAFALVSSMAAWLYHKARGDKTASFDDTLRGLGKQVINILLADPTITELSDPALLKAKAADLLWRLATSAGVPRNAITEALANTLIEHVIGDTLTALRRRAEVFAANQAIADKLPAQLDDLAARAEGVLRAFPSKTDPK